MNCVRSTILIALYILLGIQSVSHSQYYPYHNDYDYNGEQERYPSSSFPPQPSPSPLDHFRRRSADQYREREGHNYYNGPPSSVQYFGTMRNVPASKQITTENSDVEILTDESNSYQSRAPSSASYRIRYNNNPTTSEYPPEDFHPYPPSSVLPSPRESSPPFSSPRRGIGIFLDNDGGMNVYFSDPLKPDTVPQVFQFGPKTRRPRPQQPSSSTTITNGRSPEYDDDKDKSPPHAYVVVIDKRPTLQCPDENSRIYKNDGRCYVPGTGISPCGPLMLFYPEVDNKVYGDCDCVFNNGAVSRPLAFWKPHDRCYLLYQQGPCGYHEWLILDRDGYPQCASRSCPHNLNENENSQEFWFLHKGKCYQTGKYYASLCSTGQDDLKVYFPLGKTEPKCLKQPPNSNTRTLLSTVIDLRCKPGYKKMQNGDCKKVLHYGSDYDY